jgi:hypothetical protein
MPKGHSQQYLQYSQQPIMQSSSTSYTPFGFPSAVRPQQLPTGQDRGNHDNHSRPVAPTQEQRRVPSHQEPLHYQSYSRPLASTQEQRRVPSHQEPLHYQSQATASITYSQGPPPQKNTSQSQLATALGPQPNSSVSAY